MRCFETRACTPCCSPDGSDALKKLFKDELKKQGWLPLFTYATTAILIVSLDLLTGVIVGLAVALIGGRIIAKLQHQQRGDLA